jgi:hypothetical protein
VKKPLRVHAFAALAGVTVRALNSVTTPSKLECFKLQRIMILPLLARMRPKSPVYSYSYAGGTVRTSLDQS